MQVIFLQNTKEIKAVWAKVKKQTIYNIGDLDLTRDPWLRPKVEDFLIYVPSIKKHLSKEEMLNKWKS
jgi:hypothetical protein